MNIRNQLSGSAFCPLPNVSPPLFWFLTDCEEASFTSGIGMLCWMFGHSRKIGIGDGRTEKDVADDPA